MWHQPLQHAATTVRTLGEISTALIDDKHQKSTITSFVLRHHLLGGGSLTANK